MDIVKIFNNNCVSVNIDGKEQIVTGLGIGFKTKVGDPVDELRIEKRFEIIDENRKQFEYLIQHIDICYVNIARQIIEYAENILDTRIDNKLNISLTDHIAYAMERYQENIQIPSLFDDDIQTYYPQEYTVGLKAIELIEESEGIRLPKEEISYIAMHIINASSVTKISDFAQRITVFIHDLLHIIEESESIKFDRDAIEISRLVVHLKYLGRRILTGNHDKIVEDYKVTKNQLLEVLIQEKKTVSKVESYIKEKYNYTIDSNEILYLSIHLHQILSKCKNKKGEQHVV